MQTNGVEGYIGEEGTFPHPALHDETSVISVLWVLHFEHKTSCIFEVC